MSGKLILPNQPPVLPEWPDPGRPAPTEPPERPDPPELPDPPLPEWLEPPEPKLPRSLTPRNNSQHRAAVTTTAPKMAQPFLAAFRCARLCEKRKTPPSPTGPSKRPETNPIVPFPLVYILFLEGDLIVVSAGKLVVKFTTGEPATGAEPEKLCSEIASAAARRVEGITGESVPIKFRKIASLSKYPQVNITLKIGNAHRLC
jgi:hypothetical protein